MIVAGGEFNNGNQVDLDAAEIYDPVKDSWTAITTPGWGHIGDAPACVLPDGRLIMGSINDTRTAIYDPTTGSWTAGPAKHDASSEETWTLLPDGTILNTEVNNHPNAEKYVPAAHTGTGSDAWMSAGSVPAGHDLVQQTAASTEIGPAILMTDGRVFAIGASGHTALYTPPANPADAGTWTAGPDFPADAAGNPWRAFDAPAVLLPNGNVLCIAGPAENNGWAGHPCHAFEFDGTTLTQVPDPPNASGSHTWECRFLLLPNGEVLCSACSTNIQVYQPAGEPKSAWAPVIVSAPSTIAAGGTYALQGQQLNGLSQANSYGDDAQMATNFPIVRIQSGGQVFYCRTHGFSSMAVATGTDVVTTQFDVPAGVLPGSAQLCVVANGITTCTPVQISLRISGLMQHVGQNEDDRLEAFVRGADQALWHTWQTARTDSSSSWTSLAPIAPGVPIGSDPEVTSALDGHLEVFVRGTDHALWHTWQNTPNSNVWSIWEPIAPGVPIGGEPAAVLNTDDCLEVFARGTDNALLHIRQDAPNSRVWLRWEPLAPGVPFASDPVVGVNWDGHLEVFVRGTDNALWHMWQILLPHRTWSRWEPLAPGVPIGSDPVIGVNALEVFARGTDNALWHMRQTTRNDSSSWSAWEPIAQGVPFSGKPAAARNLNGHLEVFVRGTDNALWHISQTDPQNNTWAPDWEPIAPGVPFAGDPVVGVNFDGHLEVFVQGTDNGLWHIWQDAHSGTGWSNWKQL